MRILPLIFTALILSQYACDDGIVNDPPAYRLSPVDYFGFVLVDTRWDDPTDSEVKTDYLDEVSSFTNMSDILVVEPSDNIISSVKEVIDAWCSPMIHVSSLFFEIVGTNSPSGTQYALRDDFKSRWDEFLIKNAEVGSSMYHFYLGEEPTWNGISFEDLKAASDYIKTTKPASRLIIIEAAPAIEQLQVPISVDWIGFNHYFLADPYNDPTFRAEYDLLKSKRTNDEQRFVLVMDSHYIPEVHQDIFGIDIQDMKAVADAYLQLAEEEKGDVVALLGYVWPSGFDSPNAVGARHMPTQVLVRYKEIGRRISVKL